MPWPPTAPQCPAPHLRRLAGGAEDEGGDGEAEQAHERRQQVDRVGLEERAHLKSGRKDRRGAVGSSPDKHGQAGLCSGSGGGSIAIDRSSIGGGSIRCRPAAAAATKRTGASCEA